MDRATIIGQARALTGLHDFDSESFHEGLDRVLHTLKTSPLYHDSGRQMMAGLCVALLANRLKVSEFARANPDRIRPVERPVFILGAPRTGTTFVSHLLATDPDRRSLLRYEGMDSLPPPRPETMHTEPRCLAMKGQDDALKSASNIHHEEADTPTEDVIIHAHDFKSMLFDTAVDDPSYQDWVLATDSRSIFEYHKLQLQVAQSYSTGRWQLKAPSHALFIEGLRAVYPDARIIWTHRDPYVAFTSLCSLIRQFRPGFSAVNVAGLGTSNIRQFVEHFRRPWQIVDREGGASFYQLHYAQMIRDPIGEMSRIYAWLGDPFTPDIAAAMRSWIVANPQGRRGKHQYSLAPFGVSEDDLAPHFEDYIERFGIERENSRTFAPST